MTNSANITNLNPDPTAQSGKYPSLLRLSWMRVLLEIKLFFREKDALIFIFAYPIFMLAIFASTLGANGATVGPDPGIPYAQYFLPGMVATGVMLSSFQNLAMSIPIERDEGGLKRLRGMPMPPSVYFFGKTGQVLALTVVQMVLLLSVAALLFDVNLPNTTGKWVTLIWVILLGTATGSVLGVAFSSVPKSSKSAAAIVTPIVVILQFISGVFFVFSELPNWMQNLAAIFPLKWMAQGVRSAILPEWGQAMELTGNWELPKVALVLGLWLVIGLIVGPRTFAWLKRGDK